MKQVRLLMGMPIVVEITDAGVTASDIDRVFEHFISIENRFSMYKKTSEISRINRGKIKKGQYSPDMQRIMKLAEDTKNATRNYFDIRRPDGTIDPSGIVKGWAIYTGAQLVESMGYENYSVDAGGDIQVKGHNAAGKPWTIGIRNPDNRHQNVKIVSIGNQGIATSGTYIRGQHIYDPFHPDKPIDEIVSLTVIGPNIYEADRFATAAFAMRENGVAFIATLPGFDAYAINNHGIATFTPGFETYVVKKL